MNREPTSRNNFAGRVVSQLSRNSVLIDAAAEKIVPAEDVPNLITGFASACQKAGLQSGDRILIACTLAPSSTIACLGAMYAGLVPVLLENRYLAQTGKGLCSKTLSKVVWTPEGVRCDWAEGEGVLHWQGIFPPQPVETVPAAPKTDDDLAALMPTSGSTGVPRLVMVSHGNLFANTEAIIRSQHLGHDERAMLILPISYCFGASVVHTHLYQGGGVVYDSRFMFPDKVLRAIETYQCTTFAGVPTVYNMLLRRSSLETIPLAGLRRLLQAGGALSREQTARLREVLPQTKLYVMYGQTEATARISCLPPDRGQEKLGSAGLPLDNLTVRIFDTLGQEATALESGEVWVKGPSVTLGYVDDPLETQRKFRDGWLCTGDTGYLDNDGFLWLKGRQSDFMKIRGVRVTISEVETLVAGIEGVAECAARSVPHPDAGEAIALYVVPESEDADLAEGSRSKPKEAVTGGRYGVSDLAERVRRKLPPHWDCASVTMLPELPKTSSGKVARAELEFARAIAPADLEPGINALLAANPFSTPPEQQQAALLAVLQDCLTYASQRNPRLRNFIAHWPVNYRAAKRIADLPYLPVAVFKADPPLALVEPAEITRTLASSATTGQVPSRVVLDAATSKRMTKSVMAIFRDFIGSARQPYLVVDTPETLAGAGVLGARGAAIQGLRSFATEIVCCLRGENLELDLPKLQECADKWRDKDVLVYGFTYVLWNHLVQPLKALGVTLNMPNVHVLHSGGWKRLQSQAVTKEAFSQGVSEVFGADSRRIIDFYGMVENVGVVYPDCEYGNKHVPAFAEVIVRNPLTMEPVQPGERGLVQVCSALPSSFPGFLLLTEDVAEIISYDGCPCGRRGTCFRFVGRAPKAEVRGCGNIETVRARGGAGSGQP